MLLLLRTKYLLLATARAGFNLARITISNEYVRHIHERKLSSSSKEQPSPLLICINGILARYMACGVNMRACHVTTAAENVDFTTERGTMHFLRSPTLRVTPDTRRSTY